MQKTSPQTPESASSENWFDKVIEGSRQALMEGDRKYRKIDLEHYNATGNLRHLPLAPAEDATKET